MFILSIILGDGDLADDEFILPKQVVIAPELVERNDVEGIRKLVNLAIALLAKRPFSLIGAQSMGDAFGTHTLVRRWAKAQEIEALVQHGLKGQPKFRGVGGEDLKADLTLNKLSRLLQSNVPKDP